MSGAGNFPVESPVMQGIDYVLVCLEARGRAKDPDDLFKVVSASEISHLIPSRVSPLRSMSVLDRCRPIVLRKDACERSARIFARIECGEYGFWAIYSFPI